MKVTLNSDIIPDTEFERYEQDGTTYYDMKKVDNGTLKVNTKDGNSVPTLKEYGYDSADSATLDDVNLSIEGIDGMDIENLEIESL